ncbi:diguanylate cyclase [Saccharomonospora sp. NPDC046836]|uniref:diguanylate cyclase domain-containing protein n=1 Tax=Saccharomonospora sp. NPDC046836 TaxID=3156921 RepID=UPI00340B4635
MNDSLGHSIGDKVLRIVGHRLQHCVRGRPGTRRFVSSVVIAPLLMSYGGRRRTRGRRRRRRGGRRRHCPAARSQNHPVSPRPCPRP